MDAPLSPAPASAGSPTNPPNGSLRRTRDQVKAAGLAFFLKQAMREAGAGGEQLITIGAGSHVKRDLVVVAPELDGRPWAEFPTPRAVA